MPKMRYKFWFIIYINILNQVMKFVKSFIRNEVVSNIGRYNETRMYEL